MSRVPVRTENPPGEGDDGPVQAINPGAAESLADLVAEATLIDAGTPAPGAVVATAEQPAEATASDLADVLILARDMAAPMVETMGYLAKGQTREIWSDAVLKSIAEPLLEIMGRWGIGLGEALQKAGPYVGLFVGLAPPAMATWAAIQDKAQQVINDQQPQQQQQPS